MDNIDKYLDQKIAENEIRDKNLTNKQNALEKENPFAYNNPILSEIAKGTIDTVKTLYDAGAFANHLIGGDPAEYYNGYGTNFAKQVSQNEQINPRYNSLNEMSSMVPQGIAVEETGLSNLLSDGGSSIMDKLTAKALPIEQKIANKIGSTIGESTAFTATDPHALTGDGSNVYNENTIQNINPKATVSNIANMSAMIGAGKLVPVGMDYTKNKIFNYLYKNINNINDIKNNMQDTTNNIFNKIKPKYNLKDEKTQGITRQSRLYTSDVQPGKKTLNKTNNFSDVNLFNKKYINKISNDLKDDNIAIINDEETNNFNSNKLNQDAIPKKPTLLLFLPNSTNRETFILDKYSGVDKDTMDELTNHFGYSSDEINKIVKNNNIIVYKDKSNIPNKEYLQNSLEHEMGHVINLKNQGYARPFKGFDTNKKIINMKNNGQDPDELYYYMNQQEATQQLGSIVKTIKESPDDNIKLNNNEKKALQTYSDFTNTKINLDNISKQDLLNKTNDISNKLETFFNENKQDTPIEEETKKNEISNEDKEYNNNKQNTVDELKKSIKNNLDTTNGGINDEFKSLNNQVDLASKTPEEHIQIIRQLNNEIDKANKNNDINKVISLNQEKRNYTKKLYNMFGFNNDEKITRLNNQLEDIEKQISKEVTRKVKTNNDPLDIKNKGIVKKVNGKIQLEDNNIYDKHLIKEYKRLTNELIKEEKNVKTTLNTIFLNKNLYDELQTGRLNELIQKHNDLLVKKAYNGKLPEEMSTDEILQELQKNKNIEQISLKEIKNKKNIDTAFDKNKKEKSQQEVIAKNSSTLYKLEQSLKERKIQGETEDEMNKWVGSKKWDRYTLAKVKEIIKKIYKKDKLKQEKPTEKQQNIKQDEQNKYNIKKQKEYKQNTKKEQESDNKQEDIKQEQEPEKKNMLQKKIDESSDISFEYVKHFVKKLVFKIKAKIPKFKVTFNTKEILDKISDKHIVDGYYNIGSTKNIYKVSFQANNHTLNFLNETRLITHELTHLIVDKLKIYKEFNNIQIPKEIKNTYNNENISVQKEEAVALYSELRSMQDLIKNSNLSKLITDKDKLLKNINNEIKDIFGNNIIDFEKFYRNNIQYNVFYNLEKTYKEPIFNHKYFLEQADKKSKTIINNFMNKIYKTLSKNKDIKHFIDIVNGNNFVKNLIEDYKISQSSDDIYVKIRKIISDKNKMMNYIKNLNNSFVKMIHNDFKEIDRTTQEYIHNSDILNSFIGSQYDNLSDFIDRLKKNKEVLLDNFINENISGKSDLFRKIIKESSVLMNNSKFYFRNAEQIALYLQKKGMLKTDINEYLIKDIDDLLSSEYLSKNNFDSSKLKHITQESNSVLIAKEIRTKAKDILGNNYIRGYKSFISKKPLIAKLGLFDKEPTYSIDLRKGIDNNLLEFKQDAILGAEFRINDLNAKSINILKNIIKKLNNNKIPYSLIYDKDMNVIGVKRYIEPYLDKKNMGSKFDLAENTASQNTSLLINNVNKSIAQKIQEKLKGVFLTNKDIKNLKTKDNYVKLSKEEQKIFNDITTTPEDKIVYIKKEFKGLLDRQEEFLFSKDNQKIARAIELSYKNLIKEFKKNVVVKNIKSQLNNAMIILSTVSQHNLNINSVIHDIMRTPKEYKIFYQTIYNIRKEILKGNRDKAKIMFENLRRQNIYAQMYTNGLFQTMADEYLMKTSDKESLQYYKIHEFLTKIFNDKTANIVKNIKDFVLLEPNTFLGSNLLKSMNFIDITGRAVLYKNLLKKGYSIEEASRLTNESFIDFRRTYPKIINELDNYGLFFAGFMYKNSINVLKFMKDKPVTTMSIILAAITANYLFKKNSPVGIKTDSWFYQKSMATPSFIDMSMFGSIAKGKLPYQLVVPNTTLMASKAVTTGNSSKLLPVTIGNRYN